MNQNLEISFITQYQSGNEIEKKLASHQLWELNQKWIRAMAGKYAQKSARINFDELLSEAYIAFCSAINRFDLSRAGEVSLKTHAVYWINGAFTKHCKTQIHDGYAVPRCRVEVRNDVITLAEGRKSLSMDSTLALSIKHQLKEEKVREIHQFYCAYEKVDLNDWQINEKDGSSFICPLELERIRRIRCAIRTFVNKQPKLLANILMQRWLNEKSTSYTELAVQLQMSIPQIRRRVKVGMSDLEKFLQRECLINITA